MKNTYLHKIEDVMHSFRNEINANGGIAFSIIIIIGVSFLLSFFVDQYGGKNAKASLVISEEGSKSISGEWFSRSIGGKDLSSLSLNLPLTARSFIGEIKTLEHIIDIKYYNTPNGLFFSFIGGKKSDRMHPYYGAWTLDGDFIWNEMSNGEVISTEQKGKVIGAIIKNTGLYPWDTKKEWKSAPDGHIFFFSEESVILPGEEIKVFFKDKVPHFIENTNDGFTISLESSK